MANPCYPKIENDMRNGCYSRSKESCEFVGGKCAHCGKPFPPATPPDSMVRWQECGPRPEAAPNPNDSEATYQSREADAWCKAAGEAQAERDQLRAQVVERTAERNALADERNQLRADLAAAQELARDTWMRLENCRSMGCQACEELDVARKEVSRLSCDNAKLEGERQAYIITAGKFGQERDAARAECEKMRVGYEAEIVAHATTSGTLSGAETHCQRLEAAAGRMRESLRIALDYWAANAALVDEKVYKKCEQALAETDTGTRALACVKALRDTQSAVGNIHRYVEYVNPQLHSLITALQERTSAALAAWAACGKGDGDGT